MAPNFDPAKDLPDLTGKVALITGGTSGLGFAVALALLRKGATVYLAARNESKANGTITRLEAEGLVPGNGKAVWHNLSLDNPQDVKKSAEDFLAKESRLDILVNCAAILGKPYEIGPLGVQDIVTVNYMSPFVFTTTLLPLLKKTAQLPDTDVRIVVVASGAHSFVSKVQFKSKADLNGPSTSDNYVSQLKRYGYTKLLNVLFTKELARRLAASSEDGGADLMCLCLHPGAVASEGAYSGAAKLPWPLSVLLRVIMRLTFRTPENAAETVLIAAAKPDLKKEKEKYNGSYLVPVGKLSETSKMGRDEGAAKDLWSLTEKILAEEGL